MISSLISRSITNAQSTYIYIKITNCNIAVCMSTEESDVFKLATGQAMTGPAETGATIKINTCFEASIAKNNFQVCGVNEILRDWMC